MKYSNEEKLSIITRYQQGERITALSNELAISRSTLYRWLKSFPSDSIGKPLKFSYQEYASLQRKVEKLQNIITILKSADCLVSAREGSRRRDRRPEKARQICRNRLSRDRP